MSQATRALVERLKRETNHLPSNVPLHNIALETITEILDSMVEPLPEPEEVEEPEPEEAVSAAQAAVDDDVQDAEAPVDDGSGPMTTGNAPT